MALETDGIIEYGVINLVMWVVALSSKGKGSYNEPPFSKRKALYLLVNCMWGIFYVFLSTNIVHVNCAEGEQLIRAIRGCFSSTCFIVQNCPWFVRLRGWTSLFFRIKIFQSWIMRSNKEILLTKWPYPGVFSTFGENQIGWGTLEGI